MAGKPTKGPPPAERPLTEAEIAKRRDDAIRRALNTPPDKVPASPKR